jgi:hypothetical protein
MASQSPPSLTKSTGTVVESNSSAMRITDLGASGVVSVRDVFETDTSSRDWIVEQGNEMRSQEGFANER